MKYYSPERPLSGSRPAWLQAPTVVLPALQLLPSDRGMATSEEGCYWHIQIMLPSGRAFSWKEIIVHKEELSRLVSDWYSDPEDTLRRWFQAVPMRFEQQTLAGASAGEKETVKSSGDLGL